MTDKKLWKIFSQYIRMRDADESGYVQCFTCNRQAHWKRMDCGHGLGRQHKSIKFHEKNNHPQCGPCNLDGGRQDIYSQNVDKRYGKGTWDMLQVAARQRSKLTQFELDALTVYYKQKVNELLKTISSE